MTFYVALDLLKEIASLYDVEVMMTCSVLRAKLEAGVC